jgi:hypothetical protein
LGQRHLAACKPISKIGSQLVLFFGEKKMNRWFFDRSLNGAGLNLKFFGPALRLVIDSTKHNWFISARQLVANAGLPKASLPNPHHGLFDAHEA